MRNARIIKITDKNADSGKVSLQKSDIIDFIEGKLSLLIIHNNGDDILEGDFYEGKNLNELMARAVANGPVWSKLTNSTFYLATR